MVSAEVGLYKLGCSAKNLEAVNILQRESIHTRCGNFKQEDSYFCAATTNRVRSS